MDDELELSPDSNDMLMIDEDCEGDAETDQSDLNMELLNDEVGGVEYFARKTEESVF